MKKKKFFSRIFAAALAGAIAATTLVTNNGAGLLASAEETSTTETTYSVKIISPDVPAGESYTYKFYQILAGDVRDKGGQNYIVNPQWGEALGDDNFNEVPADVSDKPQGNMVYGQSDSGIGYYPLSEVLLAALSKSMACDNKNPSDILLATSANEKYKEILKSYGFNGESYFYNKFKYYLKEDGSYYSDNMGYADLKTRDEKGLVELLEAGLDNGSLESADLKAFAELLLNGVKVTIKLDSTNTNTETYTYKFITGNPQATQTVNSTDGKNEYTVDNLDPGYYLVSCVDNANNKPTNNGYESTKPIKPVSAMLVIVGPANDGVAEIVGKNAYSVPTVTLDMYQKPVKLGDNNDVNGMDTIIQASEDNWKTTGCFDYYKGEDRQEAILYRIGITLPMNFDKYEDSGYFLAVLDQYCHYGNASNYKEIKRVENVHPYVYVKQESGYKDVGRLDGSPGDGKTIGTIQTDDFYITKILNGSNLNTPFNEDNALGFHAHDLFCLGNLYGNEYSSDSGGSIFKPGDTIYIYYPAILDQNNVYTSEKYLLNVNRIWAVYSNDPYAAELTFEDGYSHVKRGEVGVTTIAEANVNTYSVKLTVDGKKGYTDGAQFALYRNVNENGTTSKEYACLYYDNYNNGSVTYVKRWIPESELTGGGKKLEEALQDYNSTNHEGYELSTYVDTGIASTGVQIRGLAAGEYYLQELTISRSSTSKNDPEHANLKTYKYELAKKPIKFKIENEYNPSVDGYLGTAVNNVDGSVTSETNGNGNSKTFIKNLTVEFAQNPTERAIDPYIKNPATGAYDVKNSSITTTLNQGDGSTVYATEDGRIEIQVYHNEFRPFRLPQTGGIGTMIFFVVGGAIVLAAVVVIVTRLRVKRERF